MKQVIGMLVTFFPNAFWLKFRKLKLVAIKNLIMVISGNGVSD